MCGRFSQTATPEILAEQFEVKEPPLFQPRYNIAPSQSIATIRIEPDTTTRQLVLLRWGLIPSWAKDPKIGNHCINAKAETIAEKPAFRSAFKERRCLVIATGFYEWQRQGPVKQPMWNRPTEQTALRLRRTMGTLEAYGRGIEHNLISEE